MVKRGNSLKMSDEELENYMRIIIDSFSLKWLEKKIIIRFSFYGSVMMNYPQVNYIL